MTIATLGAFAVHALEEAVGVMIFYQVGEFLQNLAVNRSRKSIRALLEIRPEYANLKEGNTIKRVSPEIVNPGDLLVVKPGEKIPLDGVVLEGSSNINTSVLTGESVPKHVIIDDQVLSGEINMSGMLIIKVTKPFSESSVVKILDLVENAATKKTRTEQLMTRFARYYTPAVVLFALLLAFIPPLFFEGQNLSTWIYRALVLLVISCPCALIVSIPLGYFGGIGGASRRGILIKGSNYIDVLSSVKSVVFDKTGTLTKGVFKVINTVPAAGFSESELLQFAALAESHSNHHIARSIHEAYIESGSSLDISQIQEQQEISGQGIIAKIEGKTIIAGNDLLLHKNDIPHQLCNIEGTVVHVAVNQKYAGYITVGDQIKDEAHRAIDALRKENIQDIIMLTGDNDHAARKVADELRLDGYFAGLLPEQKVTRFEQIVKEKSHRGTVAFVGDGINDSPVIARADIGIAMGALGSEAAIETADVVIMTDHPLQVAEAIRIGRRTRLIVIQNIILALSIKLLFVGLGSMGIATMWEAVFADMGVALLAVLNSVRTLHVTEKK
jgi:Cd2+/Zn2+-exporting ATPase